MRHGASDARLNRFDECGSSCTVEWSPVLQRYRMVARMCGDRFCEPCCRSRAAKVRRKLERAIGTAWPLFITLTIKPDDRDLGQLLDHLLKSFRRLRQQAVWKGAIDAAAYFVEIKLGSGSGRWHVHMHALAVGAFIPQKELSAAWRRASRGSFIVDIRRCKDADRSLSYVTKYCTKGHDAEVANDLAAFAECVSALAGRRLCGTCGAWRNLRDEVEPDDQAKPGWHRIERLAVILAAADRGEAWARVVVDQIRPGRLTAPQAQEEKEEAG